MIIAIVKGVATVSSLYTAYRGSSLRLDRNADHHSLLTCLASLMASSSMMQPGREVDCSLTMLNTFLLTVAAGARSLSTRPELVLLSQGDKVCKRTKNWIKLNTSMAKCKWCMLPNTGCFFFFNPE